MIDFKNPWYRFYSRFKDVERSHSDFSIWFDDVGHCFCYGVEEQKKGGGYRGLARRGSDTPKGQFFDYITYQISWLLSYLHNFTVPVHHSQKHLSLRMYLWGRFMMIWYGHFYLTTSFGQLRAQMSVVLILRAGSKKPRLVTLFVVNWFGTTIEKQRRHQLATNKVAKVFWTNTSVPVFGASIHRGAARYHTLGLS